MKNLCFLETSLCAFASLCACVRGHPCTSACACESMHPNCAFVCARGSASACVSAYACAFAFKSMYPDCAFVHASTRACACAYAYVRARTCARAYVRARACACLSAYDRPGRKQDGDVNQANVDWPPTITT